MVAAEASADAHGAAVVQALREGQSAAGALRRGRPGHACRRLQGPHPRRVHGHRRPHRGALGPAAHVPPHAAPGASGRDGSAPGGRASGHARLQPAPGAAPAPSRDPGGVLHQPAGCGPGARAGCARSAPWSARCSSSCPSRRRSTTAATACPCTSWDTPWMEQLPEHASRAEARLRLGLVTQGPVVALLPGSRRKEISRHLPRMLAGLQALHGHLPRPARRPAGGQHHCARVHRRPVGQEPGAGAAAAGQRHRGARRQRCRRGLLGHRHPAGSPAASAHGGGLSGLLAELPDLEAAGAGWPTSPWSTSSPAARWCPSWCRARSTPAEHGPRGACVCWPMDRSATACSGALPSCGATLGHHDTAREVAQRGAAVSPRRRRRGPPAPRRVPVPDADAPRAAAPTAGASRAIVLLPTYNEAEKPAPHRARHPRGGARGSDGA